MLRIFVVDNYDSFTYNLVQLFKMSGSVETVVKRNDRFELSAIHRWAPDGIIISPGPKGPAGAGLSAEVIEAFRGQVPILGVCLGMQCINEAFGGETREAEHPVHGKTSMVVHRGHNLFLHLPNPLRVARYHSLVIDRIPPCLEVDAYEAHDNIPMAIRHAVYPVFGLQFHPESFLTEQGESIARNFLNLL